MLFQTEVWVIEEHKTSKLPKASAQGWYLVTICCVLVATLDEGDISPKVLQLISSEKIQVRDCVSLPETGFPCGA